MGLFGSSDPAKAEAKLLATEEKHEEATIKNAMKELEQAEKAVAAASKNVESYSRVHQKALAKEQKYAEKLREAEARHAEAKAEEQRELAELDVRRSKLAEMEEIAATKKTVIAKLQAKHEENRAARGQSLTGSPTSPTGPSISSPTGGAIAATEEPHLASHNAVPPAAGGGPGERDVPTIATPTAPGAPQGHRGDVGLTGDQGSSAHPEQGGSHLTQQGGSNLTGQGDSTLHESGYGGTSQGIQEPIIPPGQQHQQHAVVGA
jgi:hypothetical protein